MSLPIGSTFATHYRIVRALGTGGYGSVHLAEEYESSPDAAAGTTSTPLRTVAIKTLFHNVFDERRYLTELRALCQLSHPNLVTVYRYGRTPCAWFAMEYVPGRTLAEVAQDGDLPLASLLHLLAAVADGLDHAHARGIVHRDLKPHNVLVPAEGPPRIVDFGLSLFLEPTGEASTRIGTPGYLAPELIAPTTSGTAPCDHRVDIYALGATICAVVTGHSPFAAPGLHATVINQVHGHYELPASFPEPLASLVHRCLAIDPFARPRTAGAVADELRHIARTLESPGAVRTETEGGRVDLRDVRVQEPSTAESGGRRVARFFALEGREAEPDDDRRSGVFVWRGEGTTHEAGLYDTIAALWPGALVSVLGALPDAARDGRPVLRLDARSSLVVDPYVPVSVTDVLHVDGSRAGPCASRLFVEMRRDETPGRALVVGSIAHELFETLARFAMPGDPSHAFDALVDAAIARRRIELLASGLDDHEVTRVVEELRGHYEPLVAWTRPQATARRGHITEAKRFSPRLGLDGRIDLALIENDRLRIVELKTGKRQTGEHRSQVRCYAALWAPAARAAGLRMEGHVLYSATGQSVEVELDGPDVPSELIARNLAVAARRYYSHGDTNAVPLSFGDDERRCSDTPCRFRRDTCRRQTAVLGNLAGRDLGSASCDAPEWRGVPPDLVLAARRWYFHFVSLIEREYRAASEAHGEVFRSTGLSGRVEALRAIEGARVRSMDATRRLVTFDAENRGVLHAGDAVVLHRADLDTSPTLRGRVDEATPTRVLVEVPGIEAVPSLPPDGWYMEREEPRIGFREMHRAIWAMISCGDADRLRALVQPWDAPVPCPSTPRAPLADDALAARLVPGTPIELNEEQAHAVVSALGDEPIVLIQGPPGTGKTGVIAEIVRRAVAQGQRVLIAAHTHAAVDTALARVLGAGVRRVLRVGSAHRATADLERALAHADLSPSRVFTEDLQADVPSLDRLATRIADADVVAATTIACQSSPLFVVLRRQAEARGRTSGRPFDLVIVDEAAQLTEPSAIAAWNRADRLILVGDDRQLPPVVRATEAHTATLATAVPEDLARARIGGLDRSLFERLRSFRPPVLLATQYRMSEAIQRFSSVAFYEGALRAAPAVADRRLPLTEGWSRDLDDELVRRLDPDRPMVWVDAQGECRGNTNLTEADELVRTIATLLGLWTADGDGSPWDRIGVVSPYRAQCHAIRTRLREALDGGRADVEIDTVERFQGREKEVMLVSLVERGWNEFVMDARRLNVTFTRARSKLIVFGRRDVGQRMQEIWVPR